jgi:hypothetical protein
MGRMRGKAGDVPASPAVVMESIATSQRLWRERERATSERREEKEKQ